MAGLAAINTNTAIGSSSLAANTTGACNTAVGYRSLYGNTSGFSNTAVGFKALALNTSGKINTAIGFGALYVNSSGICNTAVGWAALNQNSVGKYNTAVGAAALRYNTTGNYNTAVGFYALRTNTSGIKNTAVGYCALQSNTTASGSVAMGSFALFANTTGCNNIAIGINAQCALATGINNTIAIGANSVTSATTGHMVLGNTGNTTGCVYFATWTNASDKRDKANIKTLSKKLGLDFIKKLRPVEFNWDYRDRYVKECGYDYGQKDGTLADTFKDYGFIAQELKQTLDDLNETFDGLKYDEEKDRYLFGNGNLIPSLIMAVKELDDKLKEHRVEIDEIKDALKNK